MAFHVTVLSSHYGYFDQILLRNFDMSGFIFNINDKTPERFFMVLFCSKHLSFYAMFCCSVGAKRSLRAEITLSNVGLVTKQSTSLASPVRFENNTANFSSSSALPKNSQYRLMLDMKSDRCELPLNALIFAVKTLVV